MIQTAIRLKTTVLPGHRIEVIAPELIEGEAIELIVLSEPVPPPNKPEGCLSTLDFIDSLPPGPRSAASWEEIERSFREERDSWDR